MAIGTGAFRRPARLAGRVPARDDVRFERLDRTRRAVDRGAWTEPCAESMDPGAARLAAGTRKTHVVGNWSCRRGQRYHALPRSTGMVGGVRHARPECPYGPFPCRAVSRLP